MKSGPFYNGIQETFSRVFNLTTGHEPYPLRSFLQREYERLSPRSILEVGCGSGAYALPGYDYVGIDPNPHYIAYCRRHRPGVFRKMSAENLTFPDNCFDVVLCFGVAHHLPDHILQRVLAESARVLADRGVFFFADPVRPVVGSRPLAALLEWLDEGRWFRTDKEYLILLQENFTIAQQQQIADQFYRTMVLSCHKKIGL